MQTTIGKKEFLENLNKILEKESLDYNENKSQEVLFEEETIYTQRLIMVIHKL